MSQSRLAFVGSKFKMYFNICSLSSYEKEKRDCLLHTSPILSVLGECYTLQSALTESLMLSEI